MQCKRAVLASRERQRVVLNERSKRRNRHAKQRHTRPDPHTLKITAVLEASVRRLDTSPRQSHTPRESRSPKPRRHKRLAIIIAHVEIENGDEEIERERERER